VAGRPQFGGIAAHVSAVGAGHAELRRA
jgi:hypothetical protein